MKYYVQGWNTLKFIVTPDELIQLLDGFHHVVFTHRVIANYFESDKKEFFQLYRNLYNKLADGYQFEWEKDYKDVSVQTGLTYDMSKCNYGKVFQDKKDGLFYKLSDFQEPCVGINPFALYCSEDQKLYTNYSYTQLPEFIVGLEMSYPRNINYTHPIEGSLINKVTCEELDSFRVYKEVSCRLKQISKRLTFESNGKTYKPNVKISSNARKDFSTFYFTKFFKCHL